MIKTNNMRKGGKKGCLCKDGKYRKECCDGTNQGIGNEREHTVAVVNNVAEVRVISTTNG